jgi:hypothetical protein
MDQYIARPLRRCYACTALGAAHEQYRNSIQPQALRFEVVHRYR